MTSHSTLMTERLPLLYREGELVAQLLDVVANQLAIVDEEALDVRRSHWFDEALELADAAKLGALLDLAPEDWQDLGLYRAWFEAIRDATLDDGAVTVAALRDVVHRYAAAFQSAAGLELVPALLRAPGTGPAPVWSPTPIPGSLSFVELPHRRRFGPDPDGSGGPIEPLTSFTLTNRGLDPVPVAALVGGLADGPEYAPVIANVTTGEALAYLGPIRPGQRLFLTYDADATTVTARLEGRDVTDRLRSIGGFLPGVPWEDEQLQRPPKPITLVPGANALWFLTVAHYDVGGLGRALLSLAAGDMHQGRFDDARFDHALFVQPAAVRLEMTWVERLPAAVDVHLPGGQMRCPTGGTGDGLALRELLRRSIDDILARLRAAGVTTSVSLDAFAEGGPQLDRLVLVEPVVVRETGPVGADRLPGSSGQYGVSRFDNSTYR